MQIEYILIFFSCSFASPEITMTTFWIHVSLALCGLSFAACRAVDGELDHGNNNPDELQGQIESLDYGDLWQLAGLVASRQAALFQDYLSQRAQSGSDVMGKRSKHVNLGQYMENVQQAYQSDQQSLTKTQDAFQQILKSNGQNSKNRWLKRADQDSADGMPVAHGQAGVDKRGDRVFSVEMPLRVLGQTNQDNDSKKSKQIAMMKLARIGKRSATEGGVRA